MRLQYFKKYILNAVSRYTNFIGVIKLLSKREHIYIYILTFVLGVSKVSNQFDYLVNYSFISESHLYLLSVNTILTGASATY